MSTDLHGTSGVASGILQTNRSATDVNTNEQASHILDPTRDHRMIRDTVDCQDLHHPGAAVHKAMNVTWCASK